MNLIEIDGVVLPAPTDYSGSFSDLDSQQSGRSETGVMNRERVRSDIAKIKLGFKFLTQAEFELVTKAISPAKFTVKFYSGSIKTAEMYAGDRDWSLSSPKDNRWDISFSLTEY